MMQRGEGVEEYLTRIQRPGNGWGSGCTIVARKEGETAGVKWTRVTVVDNFNGEREVVYATEQGATVSACTGSYGSGIRWASHVPGASHTLDYHTNLTQAFERIFRSKTASPTT